MSGDQVLRALVLKQINGFSYKDLAFHLADSRSYRTFCRMGLGDRTPRKSALQSAIGKLRPETLEQINRLLVRAAVDAGLDSGDKVRIDTTVTESNIHHPTDSSLLWDSTRVLVRLMRQVREKLGIAFTFRDRTRAAKRRVYKINQARRQKKRVPYYRELLRICEKSMRAARRLIFRLRRSGDGAATTYADKVEHYVGLALRVVDQTQRRVFKGESVPASEKVVSIFEEHTDVIRKGGRDTEYGHKICLAVGRSTLVLDCTIEDGAPADSTLAVEAVQRLQAITGKVPHSIAMDSGFSSVANLASITHLGVNEVMFHRKKPLLDTSQMTSTPAVHKALWRFRAGVEGCVSFLKRCLGLRRATWRGRAGFDRYVHSSVFAANLLTVARLRLQHEKPKAA